MAKGRMTTKMREDGIKCSGYGVLPKYPMLDPDLELGAKALYAYFCSHRGKSETVYPSRERILNDLKINKDTYYRYLKQLLSNDYIRIDKRHGQNSAFSNNTYTIISCPEKYSQEPTEPGRIKTYALIAEQGLEKAGWGLIPKSVMLDDRISIKAKAVYAYLCAFAGTETCCSPKQEHMLHHLGISYNSLRKYLKELRTFDLLLVCQRYTDGKLSFNDYILVRNPDEAKAVLDHTVTVSGTTPRTPKRQHPSFIFTPQSAKKQDMRKQDIGNQDITKADANITSPKSLPELNNTLLKQSISPISSTKREQGRSPRKPGLMDIKEIYKKDLITEIVQNEGLPYTLCSSATGIRAAIEYITKTSCPSATADLADRQQYQLFVSGLTEMLTPGKPTLIRGASVTYAAVVDALNLCITAGTDNYGDPYAEALGFYEAVSARYNRASRKTEIKNPLGYMKAMIWTELISGELESQSNYNYYTEKQAVGE